MNQAGGAAGGAGGKVVLLNQQRGTSGAGALAANGYAIDPAANYGDVKPPAVQWFPQIRPKIHARLDAPGVFQLF